MFVPILNSQKSMANCGHDGEKHCATCGHWVMDPIDPYRYVRLEDSKEVSIKKKEEKKKSPELDIHALAVSGVMLLLLAAALL